MVRRLMASTAGGGGGGSFWAQCRTAAVLLPGDGGPLMPQRQPLQSSGQLSLPELFQNDFFPGCVWKLGAPRWL